MSIMGKEDRKFELGSVRMTPGIRDRLFGMNKLMYDLFHRHSIGDWGDLDKDDKDTNDYAVENNLRIFSAYKTVFGSIWIITEADRSNTTMLLPEEYLKRVS